MRGGRPRIIAELEGERPDALRPGDRVVYVHGAWLWERVTPGCLVCIEEDPERECTLGTVEEPARYVCLRHGDLDRVRVRAEKKYVFEIDGVARRNHVWFDDYGFVPRRLTRLERRRLVQRFLDAADMEEQEAGPYAGDD